MKPVRRLMKRLSELDVDTPPIARGSVRASGALRAALPPEPPDVDGLLRGDPVTMNDVLAALQTTKPSSDGNMAKYVTCII